MSQPRLHPETVRSIDFCSFIIAYFIKTKPKIKIIPKNTLILGILLIYFEGGGIIKYNKIKFNFIFYANKAYR